MVRCFFLKNSSKKWRPMVMDAKNANGHQGPVSEEFPYHFPLIFSQQTVSLHCGMDAVPLVEMGDAAYPLQEKGNQVYLFLFGQSGEDFPKARAIFRTHIG